MDTRYLKTQQNKPHQTKRYNPSQKPDFGGGTAQNAICGTHGLSFSWDAMLAFFPARGALLLAGMLMCYAGTELEECPPQEAHVQEEETSDRT